MSEQQKRVMIRIVSIVSWVFAALCMTVVIFLIPSLSDASQPNIRVLVTVFSVLTLAYALIAWGLGKFKTWAAILALVIYGLNFISNCITVTTSPVVSIGIVMGLAMIVLIVLGWKVLQK